MKKKLTLIALLLVVIMPFVRGQDEKFKALFMYNFTKYLEWPSQKETGDFVINVYGNSPIIDELKVIAKKKQVGNQKIVVNKVTSLDECVGCNILFIPKYKIVPVADIESKLGGKGVLVITDYPGMAKKVSSINYVKQNGKQNFEVNKSHLEAQGLKVNTQLTSLGIRVD